MGFVEDCQYIRRGWQGQEINVHILEEPLLFDDCKSTPQLTLGIDDGSRIYLAFTCYIDRGKENYIIINELQGDHSSFSIQHYGTMLLSALFDFVVYMENKYHIVFLYIYGYLHPEDKRIYFKKRERYLTDFYADAVPYIKQYVPQKNISIEFYQDIGDVVALQGLDIPHALYFKYKIEED